MKAKRDETEHLRALCVRFLKRQKRAVEYVEKHLMEPHRSALTELISGKRPRAVPISESAPLQLSAPPMCVQHNKVDCHSCLSRETWPFAHPWHTL